MKITEAMIYYIELDEEEYKRYSATNWTKVMGEIDVPVYNCAWLEKEFQEALEKRPKGLGYYISHGGIQ